MKVDLSCPIELWEYELPADDNPICSFTFFNLGERTISSIQITVTLFDERDEVLSRRVERPMALEALGREPFVVILASEGLSIEAVDLTIDKVWYEDGSEWRRQQDVRLVDYEPNELPPNRRLEQLRFVAGNDAVGFPSDQGNVWICVCGRVNAAEEYHCRRCDRAKEDVFGLYSPEAVQASIDARENELEDKARQAREEASRQEFMRQDKARRKRRARRTRTIVISAALVIAVLSYLFVVLGLPELKYQTAMTALASNDVSTARASFEELMDYRDSAQMVKECDLRMASEYASSGEIAKVDRALELLAALGTYPGAQELAGEATYQKAQIYMADKEYAKASVLFAGLGDFRDAKEQRNQADYQLAKAVMDSKDYTTAAAKFAELGNYLDAAALARECVYRPAMQMMIDGEYNQAAEMFASIAGYKDSDDQRLQSIYKDALRAQLANDPEYAAERFALLGEYEDSPEQVKHSIYLAANNARDSGKYEMAIKLYATIPEYQDASEQVKACTYLPAKALMADGQYAEAAAMFGQVPGYLDADELYNQSIYLPAEELVEDGDFEAAIALYEQIPEYSDVAKLLPQTEYKLGEQQEEEGKYEEAAETFAALGEYSDASERANEAQYAWAEEAFKAGEFTVAAERFEGLGKYKDAQARVKECSYEMAMATYESGDLQAAYDELVAIDGYVEATEKAREVAYAIGEKLTKENDLEGAAEAFGLAGKYEDAAERKKDSIYNLALSLLKEEKYPEAGALFDSISGYTDARARRDEAYDLWLADKADKAKLFYDDEDYQAVVDLLKEHDMATLPKAYSDLQTMYFDANLKIARQYIAADKALDAYGYLMAAKGYRNADALLDKNIYRILGTWETEDGERMAFYLNGTALVNGETVYFNMFNPYGISTGKTDDPKEMTRVMSYSGGTENTLQLRQDSSGKTLKLTRVRAPEVSPTKDNEASTMVIPEEDLEHMKDPVVDSLTIGDTDEDEAPTTEEPTAEEPATEEEEADG